MYFFCCCWVFFFVHACRINKCTATESWCLAMRRERAGRQMESVPPQLIKDQFFRRAPRRLSREIFGAVASFSASSTVGGGREIPVQILMLICFHIKASVTERSNKSAFLLFCNFFILSYLFTYLRLDPYSTFCRCTKHRCADMQTHFLGPSTLSHLECRVHSG